MRYAIHAIVTFYISVLFCAISASEYKLDTLPVDTVREISNFLDTPSYLAFTETAQFFYKHLNKALYVRTYGRSLNLFLIAEKPHKEPNFCADTNLFLNLILNRDATLLGGSIQIFADPLQTAAISYVVHKYTQHRCTTMGRYFYHLKNETLRMDTCVARDMVELTRVLKSNTRVSKLDLTNCTVYHSQLMDDLVKALIGNTTLTHLNILHTHIAACTFRSYKATAKNVEDARKGIIEELFKNSTLKRLDIAWCDSSYSVMNVLQQYTTLQMLERTIISDNPCHLNRTITIARS